MLSQPDSPLIPGKDLDVREISLSHLVTHLDVLGGEDDYGVSGEVFVNIAVAAVVEETDGGVETVSNRPGPVRKLRLCRFPVDGRRSNIVWLATILTVPGGPWPRLYRGC